MGPAPAKDQTQVIKPTALSLYWLNVFNPWRMILCDCQAFVQLLKTLEPLPHTCLDRKRWKWYSDQVNLVGGNAPQYIHNEFLLLHSWYAPPESTPSLNTITPTQQSCWNFKALSTFPHVDLNHRLLDCDAMQLCGGIPTFWRTLLPPSSGEYCHLLLGVYRIILHLWWSFWGSINH